MVHLIETLSLIPGNPDRSSRLNPKTGLFIMCTGQKIFEGRPSSSFQVRSISIFYRTLPQDTKMATPTYTTTGPGQDSQNTVLVTEVWSLAATDPSQMGTCGSSFGKMASAQLYNCVCIGYSIFKRYVYNVSADTIIVIVWYFRHYCPLKFCLIRYEYSCIYWCLLCVNIWTISNFLRNVSDKKLTNGRYAYADHCSKYFSIKIFHLKTLETFYFPWDKVTKAAYRGFSFRKIKTSTRHLFVEIFCQNEYLSLAASQMCSFRISSKWHP